MDLSLSDLPLPEPRALARFWAFYDAVHSEVQEELRAEFADHPQLGPVIVLDDPARRRGEDESHGLLRAAVEEGDWQPYVDSLRRLGAYYAVAGVSMHGWMSLMIALRKGLVRRLSSADDPDDSAGILEGLQQFKDLIVTVIGETFLQEKENVIARQHEAIAELSTPVLPLTAGILLLPIVGVLDSGRAAQLTEQLLDSIRRHRARVAIIDITGVAAVDSAVANHLLQTVKAVGLMGARAIVSGISPINAQVLVRIGVDLEGLHTVADLQSGLATADRILGRTVTYADPHDPSHAETR